jgi:hypothetical protein
LHLQLHTDGYCTTTTLRHCRRCNLSQINQMLGVSQKKLRSATSKKRTGLQQAKGFVQ